MVINVVSGKGGTGKTLLCATIADILGDKSIKSIVIDMDFAVRGLTALLYYYKGESYYIVQEGKQAIYDYFEENIPFGKKSLGIEKYRSFDVLPAVARIDTLINHKVENMTFSDIESKLHILLGYLKTKYEFVILDSRAGYDELNSVIHSKSDITICVQEEDEISYITAINLIRQFENESNRPVVSIVNKARNIKDLYDLKYSQKKFFGPVSYLGSIPFDMDVMQYFGEPIFWEKMKNTLYHLAVMEILNKISKKFDLPERFDADSIRPLNASLEKRLGYLVMRDRTLLIFTLCLTIGGVIFSITGVEYLRQIIKYYPERVASLAISIIGFMGTLFILFKSKNQRKW
jgi:septum site-determining protein MinD